MHPETAKRLATKLYGFFVNETATPDPTLVNDLANTYLQNGTVIKPVLQRLFTSPQFQDASIFFTRYAWPVEFVVRSLKETGWTGFSVAGKRQAWPRATQRGRRMRRSRTGRSEARWPPSRPSPSLHQKAEPRAWRRWRAGGALLPEPFPIPGRG